MAPADIRIELLADELKRLTGWGVEPSRLATKPVLSELAGVQPSLPRVTAGCIIGRYLVEAIDSLDGTYEFLDRRYDAHQMRRAYKVALAIEQANRQAPARQYLVMKILSLDYSYDQWRKHPRLQRAFLAILAEHMVKRADLQSA
jgi:hypothetical protein